MAGLDDLAPHADYDPDPPSWSRAAPATPTSTTVAADTETDDDGLRYDPPPPPAFAAHEAAVAHRRELDAERQATLDAAAERRHDRLGDQPG